MNMSKTQYQLKLYFKRFLRYLDYLKYFFKAEQIEKDMLTTMPSRQESVSSFLDMLDRTLHTYFQYKSDNIDFSKHPYTFYVEKTGDCDDFSAFALHVIRKVYPELESHLMIAFNAKEGHAICVVKDKYGNYHHISNWGYIGAYGSLDDCASGIFLDWTSWWKMSYNLSIEDYKQR